VEGEVAVEGRHDVLEEGAKGGGTGDPFSARLEENGIGGIELQNGFEFLGAKVRHPSFPDFGESYDCRSLRRSAGSKGQCDDGRRQERNGGAARDCRSFGSE
jgi:hypothetical protein